MADRQHLERLCRDLTEKGLLIEAGWVSLRLAAIPLDAPSQQLDEMRTAFFAGAQHLFSSIMVGLDPGEEPTEADLGRIKKIDDELQDFIADFTMRHCRSEGSA